MLADAQWAEFEPLIEACRPKGKTPPKDLRRTISAILWRHQNAAKWRAIPDDLGPWWRAAQTPDQVRGRLFIRWARLGVWERLLLLAQERGGPGARGPTRDDVSGRHQHPRAPQGRRGGPQRGSSAERDSREALGRSRGGYGTKACVIADGLGRAVAFILAPGHAHKLPQAIPLLNRLPGVPKWVVADRGFSSLAFCEHIWERGAQPAIPSK